MAAEHDAGLSMAMAIHGPISRADLPGLCDRICTLLRETHPRVVHCDVRSVDPDVVTVDALARLQLAAKRQRCLFRLVGASEALRGLVELMGLDDVLVDA
ncbi:MAG TPA: STAS domain-containing protein [Candidatus Dormibacteraeota bacterium]